MTVKKKARKTSVERRDPRRQAGRSKTRDRHNPEMRVRLRRVSVDRIRPLAYNPRKRLQPGDVAYEQLHGSLNEFGMVDPLVWNERTGNLVGGHQRYWLALEKFGARSLDVSVVDLPPDGERALNLALNKVQGEWDEALLAETLGALSDTPYADATGFTAEEVATLQARRSTDASLELTDVDEIPPKPPKATTQRGDVWLLGEQRLMCGDSANAADVDRLLAGAVIHLVNTDPPYNVNVEPRSNNAIAAGLAGRRGHHQSFDRHRGATGAPTHRTLRAKDRPLMNDFVSPERFDALLAGWFGNMSRVLIPGGGFYIWGGYANCVNYPPALAAAGLYFSQAIIWVKGHPVLTRKDFMGNHEWCFYGWREGGAHRWFGPRNVPDVWQIVRADASTRTLNDGLRVQSDGAAIDIFPAVETTTLPVAKLPKGGLSVVSGPSDVWAIKKVSPQNMVHLTEKPVALAERAMGYSTRPGEHILDLFGGSGSTLIAAHRTGRRAYLMELDPLYCDVIVQRWEAFTGRKAQRDKCGRAANGR